MPTALSMSELARTENLDLGVTSWLTIGQDRINAFANTTGDEQWLHVDPVRAAAGPYGTTIAHGYLTLSLMPLFMRELLTITDARQRVNYGIDSLRFTDPVPVGSDIRARATLVDSTARASGQLYRVDARIEVQRGDRPAMVGVFVYLAS
jgi:acyl dehydratase